MAGEIEIRGLREMREAMLRKIPLEMQGKVLQKALVAGSRITVDRAKALAPGSNTSSRNTGILKASIHSERDRTNSVPGFEARVIRVRSRRGGRKANATNARRLPGTKENRTRGSGAPYWWYVEFGTRKQSAQPFLRPAFDATVGDAAQAIVRGLQDALVEAVRRARWETPRT